MSADQHRPSKPPRGRAPLDTLDKLDSLRPSSLPPELGDLDFSWDDDLVAQNSRPIKPAFAPLELELDLDEGDRPTAVPEIPMDQFVARAMAQVEKEEFEPVPPSSTPPNDARPLTGPPTLREGSGATKPIEAYDPFPRLRSANSPELRLKSVPPVASTRKLDPLALDISDMNLNCPDTDLMPTEPPEQAASLQTTVVPADDDPQRRTEADAIGAITLPPGEDTSRPTMKDRYAMGDFSGALEIAESLLAADPSDLEAQRYATSCRDVLTQMYLSRVGGLDQIISVVLPPEELRWLNLDHRAGFLLSLVDGVSTVDELLDISGMSRLDALRILATLREQRAILLSTR
jgi:hypothetical protein